MPGLQENTGRTCKPGAPASSSERGSSTGPFERRALYKPLVRQQSDLLSWLLWKARKLVFPGAIQIAKRGKRRLPHRSEALSLALGALGTVNRHAGVMTLNIKSNDRRVALVLIEDAEFAQDSQGNTTLDEINDES